MNRRTFAAQIAKRTGYPANAIKAILEAAIAILAGELAETGRFAWRGLGTFTVRSHAGRNIHNPSTGQVITLPPRKTVAFKPSLNLKSKLEPPVDLRRRKLPRASLARRTR